MGLMLHAKLNNLLNEGDIDETVYAAFYQGCSRNFYFECAKYAQKWFPLDDELLIHARFVEFTNRQTSSIDDVLNFIKRSVELVCVAVAWSYQCFVKK